MSSTTPSYPIPVEEAKSLLLNDLLGRFELQSDSDKAHALALLLLPHLREEIEGLTPIHLVLGPSEAAQTLAEIAGVVSTGACPPSEAFSLQDRSMTRALRTLLKNGHPMAIILDVPDEGVIDSPVLSALVTAHVFALRCPGTMNEDHFENRKVWIMTAHKPDFAMTTARRCIPVRMGEVVFTDTVEFCQGISADLETYNDAIKALVNHWKAQGKPINETQTLGSFEHWADVRGGVLECCGIPGFLEGYDEYFEGINRSKKVGS